jgi:hypothetical protein
MKEKALLSSSQKFLYPSKNPPKKSSPLLFHSKLKTDHMKLSPTTVVPRMKRATRILSSLRNSPPRNLKEHHFLTY